MIGYFLFGGFRNLLGIALLTVLVWAGLSVTPALLIVVSVGFLLYTIQVRLFIGDVHIAATAGMFVLVFCANRIILWLLYERLGAPIYAAQISSILLLTSGSYFLLRSWRKVMRPRDPTNERSDPPAIDG